MLTAQELIDLPAHGAQKALLRQELQAINRALDIIVLGKINLLANKKFSDAVAEEIVINVVKWAAIVWCDICSGDGYLFSEAQSEHFSCPACDGGELMRQGFTTDLDGNILEVIDE